MTFAKFIQCSAKLASSYSLVAQNVFSAPPPPAPYEQCALQDMLLVKRFVFFFYQSRRSKNAAQLLCRRFINSFSLSFSSLLFRIRIDKLNQEFLVYFVATSLGQIYKIVQFMHYGQRHSNLVDIFDASPRNEPIRELTLSQKTASLYLATDHQVKQIDLAMCARRYDSCFRCVADPYCGWDKEVNACRPYQLGLLQDVANETSGICDTSVLRKRVTSSYGQTLHLSCFVKMPDVLRKKQTRWYHHSTEKGR